MTIALRGAVTPFTHRGADRTTPTPGLVGSAPARVDAVTRPLHETFTASVNACSAIASAAGAVAGRGATVAGCAAAGATLAHLGLQAVLPALPAPVGVGLGLVAGLTAGVALEAKTRVGRVWGGLAGAIAGMVAGASIGACGWRPSPALTQATAAFSLPALPPRLADPSYIGSPTLRHDATARQALHATLPGDIVVSHHENHFEAAAMISKVAGARADYTHAGLVTERGTVIDMVATGARELPLDTWLRFTHLAVLRPRYASVDTLLGTVQGARAAMHTSTYDDDLRLDNEPTKEYCTEFIYRRLQTHAPEIEIREQRFAGRAFVTPDAFIDAPQIDTVYDSGSHFWLNLLRRVC